MSPTRVTPERVLLLGRGLGPGGMERLLVNQVAFGDHGRFAYSVAYISPHKDQLVPELEALGVPVHCVAQRGTWWPLSLRRLLREPGFDIVHVHSPLVASVIRVVSRLRRRRPRIVYTEHNSWGPYSVPTRWANRVTYRLDDAQIAVSNAARSSVPVRLRGRLEVVDHGIDLDAVRSHLASRAEARARLGVGDDEVVVGTVANLRPEKNYDGLLRVAGRITTELPSVTFVSIGQGPLEEEIGALHARSGLGDRFRLMGHQVDAPSLMAGFDVFVLASHWEGLPVAFMEARALGLPVVVTAVGGLVDHVCDGVDGLLVPPRDDDSLVAALRRVLTDEDLRVRMGRASAAAAEDFDARIAVGRIEQRYTSR